LSVGAEAPAERPASTRLRAVLVAAAPTARVAHLGPAALTATLALTPVLVTLARGGTDLGTPLIVAGLASGAVLGWATEDPAADVLASMPVSNPIRAALRLVFVATVALLGLTTGALAMALGPGLPMDRGDRVPEGLAAATIALAIGFVLARRGERGAGPASVTAGFLLTAFIGGLALRWPDVFPAFFAGPIHDRWWIIALVPAAVAVRAGRDPARR
jgi:hypothetical protein